MHWCSMPVQIQLQLYCLKVQEPAVPVRAQGAGRSGEGLQRAEVGSSGRVGLHQESCTVKRVPLHLPRIGLVCLWLQRHRKSRLSELNQRVGSQE